MFDIIKVRKLHEEILKEEAAIYYKLAHVLNIFSFNNLHLLKFKNGLWCYFDYLSHSRTLFLKCMSNKNRWDIWMWDKAKKYCMHLCIKFACFWDKICTYFITSPVNIILMFWQINYDKKRVWKGRVGSIVNAQLAGLHHSPVQERITNTSRIEWHHLLLFDW